MDCRLPGSWLLVPTAARCQLQVHTEGMREEPGARGEGLWRKKTGWRGNSRGTVEEEEPGARGEGLWAFFSVGRRYPSKPPCPMLRDKKVRGTAGAATAVEQLEQPPLTAEPPWGRIPGTCAIALISCRWRRRNHGLLHSQVYRPGKALQMSQMPDCSSSIWVGRPACLHTPRSAMSIRSTLALRWLRPASAWLITMARLTSDSVNDDKKLKLQHCSWLPLPLRQVAQVGLGLVWDHLKLGRKQGLVRDHLKLGRVGLVRDHLELEHLWLGIVRDRDTGRTVKQTSQQLGTMQGTRRAL